MIETVVAYVVAVALLAVPFGGLRWYMLTLDSEYSRSLDSYLREHTRRTR